MVTPRKTTEITEITEMEMIIQFINSSKMQYINEIRYYKSSAPKMQKLEKGTECVKLLLSQASKDMYEPLVPMFFPIFGAYVSGSEFQYPSGKWLEMCGKMANLVAESRGIKS